MQPVQHLLLLLDTGPSLFVFWPVDMVTSGGNFALLDGFGIVVGDKPASNKEHVTHLDISSL
jgi:hypothetical protein